MRTHRPLRRVSIARVALLAGCLALAACGGGDENSAAAGSGGVAGTGTGGTDTGGTAGTGTGGTAGTGTGGTAGTDTGGTGGTDTGGAAGTGGTTPAVEGDNADDCHDNIDNDQNGLTDCADPNCEGVTCRPGNGACDAPELCENFECPADELEPDTTVCRASAGGCDLAESCTGTSPDCPANTFVAAATVCRPSAGVCDVEEVCTGSSPTCPLNTFAHATTVCRAAVGVCDASEFCTGSSSACPSDGMQPVTHVCRSANPEGCDAPETCDGSTNTCPADVMLSPLSGFTSIVARSDFSCALSSTSGVVCWGLNDNGQLGDGTQTTRDIPTSVTGLGSGVIAVSVGARHACALTSAGAVKCWGDNATGQLGNGTMVSSAIPVSVSGLSSGVTAIAAGGAHTCARLSSGSVQCWGNNMYGSLGDGTTTNRTAPTNVTGLSSGVVAITAGADHTCALTTTGGIKCWGDAYWGQVGDGTWTQKNTPVNVSGLTSGVAAVAAGMIHTCAITTGGGLKCWGGGTDGQLGEGASFHRSTPVNVVGLASGVTAVAADASSTCAITATGNVKCWGSAAMDMSGNVGDWTVPFDVSGVPTDVTGVAVGRAHACVLTNAGGILCWGDNDYGQVGNGLPSDWRLPTTFPALSSDTARVAIQGQHGCALTSSGGVKCWGSNGYGQLGNGTTSASAAPVDVTGLSAGVTSLATGQSDSYAVTSQGALKCWGYCYGNSSSTPTDVASLTSGVAAVTQGFGHTCVLTTVGGAKCWGWNMDGQVGNGSSQDAMTPTDVEGLTSGVTAIAAGGKHTCALMSTGGVKCWGDNEWGQLGAGSGFDSWAPQDVPGLNSGIIAIAAGRSHACALTTEGAVKCWGANDRGQLGTVQGGVGPLDVFGLNAGIAAIAAGRGHTCAVTVAGGVKCWGGNEVGQLGDGSTSNSLIPMDVPGLSSGFGSVATGENHTCAVTTAGAVSCWGLNDFGLVTGLASWSPAPVCGAPGGT